MTNLNAFGVSTDISFVIKNTSSIGRSIKVFNTKLNPGGTLDLMKIPGVTEEDIRSELIKGSLKKLLSGGSLTVVSSSVDFSTVDATHGAFLSSLGINLGSSSASQTALSQADWYIDPTNGNDQNSGATSATALKTFKELSRRWGIGNTLAPPGAFSGNVTSVTVNILDTLPDTDPLEFNVVLARDVKLFFVGASLATTPLAVTSVRNKNRSSNTPWGLTLTSGDAEPLVGKKILDTTTGTSFWGVKDEGSGVLRTSEPLIPAAFGGPDNGYYNPVTSRATPLNSHTFVIQPLVNVAAGGMTVTGADGSPNGPEIIFRNLGFPYSCPTPTVSGGAAVTYYDCWFSVFIGAPSLSSNCFGCLLYKGFPGPPAIFWISGGFLGWFGGAFIFTVDIFFTDRANFDMDMILQRPIGGIIPGPGAVAGFGTVGIFESLPGGFGNTNGAGVFVFAGGTATCKVDGDSTNTIWGSDQVGPGIHVSSGASFIYDGYTPGTPVMTITGSTPGTDDFSLAGSNSTYVPTLTTPSGPFTTSWANLATVFTGGISYNPIYNSWIMPNT